MRHAALVIDGILRDPITGQPDDHGRDLYHAIANNYRLTLLADDHKYGLLSDWLRVERFIRHTNTELIPATYIHDLTAGRLHQIRHQRARGPVDLVITPEPHIVTDLYAMGQPCLLYTNPRTLGQLPPQETWHELAARIDETRTRAAQALTREDP